LRLLPARVSILQLCLLEGLLLRADLTEHRNILADRRLTRRPKPCKLLSRTQTSAESLLLSCEVCCLQGRGLTERLVLKVGRKFTGRPRSLATKHTLLKGLTRTAKRTRLTRLLTDVLQLLLGLALQLLLGYIHYVLGVWIHVARKVATQKLRSLIAGRFCGCLLGLRVGREGITNTLLTVLLSRNLRWAKPCNRLPLIPLVGSGRELTGKLNVFLDRLLKPTGDFLLSSSNWGPAAAACHFVTPLPGWAFRRPACPNPYQRT
jgi:hypothetical protein